MAITARFQADFSTFLNAVQQADVRLADFGKGATSVESKLNRMVDNFSGRQVIQEATLMGAAIQKIGGVSQLSASDLERVGQKANEAAAFMKRLGLDGAASMQQLANQVNTAKGFTIDFAAAANIAAGALGALGINLGLAGIVNFGKAIFTAADNLTKLHDKTGISVEGLQRFQVAGDDAGNSIDEITSAVAKLENKLVGGDRAAVSALDKLGLSFEDIQKLTPENQFIAISDAIRKIEDPAQQVNIAMALFGKAGAEVLPTLKRGFEDLKGSAAGMSKETVKAFDDAGDAIGRWWRLTKGYTAEAIVRFAQLAKDGFIPAQIAISDFEREAQRTAQTVADLTAQALKLPPHIARLGPDAIDANAALDLLNDTLQAGRRAENDAAEAARKHAEELAKLAAATTGIRFGTFIEDTSKLNALIPDLSGHISAMADVFAEVRDHADDLESSWIELNRVESETGAILGGTVIPMFAKLPNVVAQATDEIKRAGEAGETFRDTLLASLSNIPDLFIKAFTGGGGVAGALKAIAVDLGRDFGTALAKNINAAITAGGSGFTALTGKLAGATGAVTGLGVALSGASGKAAAASTVMAGVSVAAGAIGTGATIGGAVALGAATAGIGLAAVGAYAAIKHFLNDTEKQINPVRQAFVDLAGGLGALNEKAHAAGVTLDAMLNAKNPEQYKKAIDDLNNAFDTQKAKVAEDSTALGLLLKGAQDFQGTLPSALQDSINKLITMGKVSGDTKDLLAALSDGTTVSFGTMRDIAQKYGADLNNLGPKFEAAKIGDMAKTIINDFDTLQRGLGDTDEALRVMRKPINDIVNDSLKFGVAIPENMRPWVEQLEKTGQLVDGNGVKLTDLSGLKFAGPIETQFDTLIRKISELVDKISGPNGLTAGINGIPAKKTVEIVTVHTDVGGNDNGGPAFAANGGLVTAHGIQYLAGGGRVLSWPSRGSDTVRAMLTPGEGVVSRRGMATIGAAGLAAINRGSAVGGGGVDLGALQEEVSGLRQDLADRDRLLPKSIRDAIMLSPSVRAA